jgi:hypothetical protein
VAEKPARRLGQAQRLPLIHITARRQARHGATRYSAENPNLFRLDRVQNPAKLIVTRQVIPVQFFAVLASDSTP